MKVGILFFLLMASALRLVAAEPFVDFTSGDVLLNRSSALAIYVSGAEQKGVGIAAGNLARDLWKVCGAKTSVSQDETAQILVGTLGHAPVIDRMVKQKRLDVSALRGKREMFLIQLVGEQLVIAGSDRRGAIYGIYELSRQIGVSPWYDWADAPIAHHDSIYLKRGVYTDGEPAVRYRGLFLNDEAPCLTSWVKNTYGTNYGDHRFYGRVFELILRLRGNMLWPAMWGWAFYADDALNSKTADEMGVIIGTSHHEPMARNHQEWARNRKKYGAWNYQTNQAVLDKFFEEGVQRMKNTEDIVTIGMRGDGDEAMSEEADTRLMKKIVANQRDIIRRVTGRKAEQTPQVWALYKEVMDYYDKGMRVPDDVTILLCDDNWGNVRRVPSERERRRPGGWGLYYHVDYVGAPRNSKWLNVTPTQNMWEQLQLAYRYGIDRMWMLNVGDLKPMEYPISLFMDMAWNPTRYTADNLLGHTRDFCLQQFGERQADEAARILNLIGKYNGLITAEMLDAKTYSVETGEWKQMADNYMRLEAEALRQYVSLEPVWRDCYRQLILFPVQAMSNIYQMYYAQAMNHRLYERKDREANVWADRVVEAFKRDSLLCLAYNKEMAQGKWDGMMTQKHIGYTSWNDNFPKDMLPAVYRVDSSKTTAGGYEFSEKNGVVVMDAEHYYAQQPSPGTSWTVIPYMGRGRSAITLMPQTADVKGASLDYRFALASDGVKEVDVYVMVKSTLDFLNKGGLCYEVSIDGGEPQRVNFNANLNEAAENIYSVYYPTVARRVVISKVRLAVPSATDESNEGNRREASKVKLAGSSTGKKYHTLTIRPLDPAIVFQKLLVDVGGYQPTYLLMDESPYVWR